MIVSFGSSTPRQSPIDALDQNHRSVDNNPEVDRAQREQVCRNMDHRFMIENAKSRPKGIVSAVITDARTFPEEQKEHRDNEADAFDQVVLDRVRRRMHEVGAVAEFQDA